MRLRLFCPILERTQTRRCGHEMLIDEPDPVMS
jgi:hypothetical protein